MERVDPSSNDSLIPAWVDGTLTPVGKLEVHQRGLRHKAVSVFLLMGNDILIQRRALEKYHTPGLWANTCCTHPFWNETSLDCALRRLDDELGLTGIAPQFRDQVEYRADVGGGLVEHEVVDVFVAKTDHVPSLSPNPDEVMDTRWISFNELRSDTGTRSETYTPWLRIYLDDFADRIFRSDFT